MPKEITQEPFGQRNGKDVTRYTLSSSGGGLVVRILNYGGIIHEILVPDRQGTVADINLGHDDVKDYAPTTPGKPSSPNMGASVIGRVANRIDNASFTLDGVTYRLTANSGATTLHGGTVGFNQKHWSASIKGDNLVLQYVSADGEEGFPGELTTTVTYTVTDLDELRIHYQATTTKPTPVDLTNHAYFNLAGHDACSLKDHMLSINAESFLPLKDDFIPTGEIKRVEGTPWDLRTAVQLTERIPQVPGGKGFVFTFCLPPNPSGEPQLASRVDHEPSGRYMECWTTEPALVFYTSGLMSVPNAKGGKQYVNYGAFCLEAQKYPDGINQPSFPSPVLRPGETYKQTTVYKFGAK